LSNVLRGQIAIGLLVSILRQIECSLPVILSTQASNLDMISNSPMRMARIALDGRAAISPKTARSRARGWQTAIPSMLVPYLLILDLICA
jgi:hypothetical protein